MKHGTRAAYANGCKCLSCRSANAAYQSEYRRLKRVGKTPLGAKVSAIEAWRRIREIKSEFLTRTELAHRLGWKDRHIQIDRKKITLRNWLKIRRFHRIATNEDAEADGDFNGMFSGCDDAAS